MPISIVNKDLACLCLYDREGHGGFVTVSSKPGEGTELESISR